MTNKEDSRSYRYNYPPILDRLMDKKDDFCGYVCGPELDKIKSFIETLRPLLKVNPELVKVMIGKARNEIYLFEEDMWREERKEKEHEHHWESVYHDGGKVGVRCCDCNEFVSSISLDVGK